MPIPKEKIKHQLYRHNNLEVVLLRPSETEENEEGRPGRVTAWWVQPTSLERGEVVLDDAISVPASELQMIGRVVWA